MAFADSLADYLESLCTDKPKAAPSVDESRWREALPIIGPYIRRDLRIEQTEAIEDVLKAYLVPALRQTTGADNRLLADWSRKMGFVLKHKPYGVKCAVPLGYSIFFLKPGEGFSFPAPSDPESRSLSHPQAARPRQGISLFVGAMGKRLRPPSASGNGCRVLRIRPSNGSRARRRPAT